MLPISSSTPPEGLEKPHDLSFQRMWWIVERCGWFAMILVMVLGLSGVFGDGPASGTEVVSGDGRIRLEYERFARCRAASELRLTLPAADVSRYVEVAISRDYLDSIKIERLVPTPDSVAGGDDEASYRFRLDPGASPLHIVFDVRMAAMGIVQASMRIDDGAPLQFAQFVYP